MRISVLFACLTLAATAFAEPEKTKILVVHVQRVIDETTEGREFVKKLSEEMAAAKLRFADEEAKIKGRVKELSKAELNDRTTEFYDEYVATMKTHTRLQMEAQLFMLKKTDEIARATNELIRGAQQEARNIMRARGADMVMVSRMGPLQINNDKEFQNELIFRRVLCSTPDVDITDEVIKRMNKWYKDNKGGKAKPVREGAGKVTPASKENK